MKSQLHPIKRLSPVPKPGLFTAADFDKMPEGPPYYELVENRLVEERSPEIPHQLTSSNLHFALMQFVRQHKLGIILAAPMDVHLDQNNVFQPDILFIAGERWSELVKDGRKIHGAPDLVVEILSTNQTLDMGKKQHIYARYGVREFWRIDPQKQVVEVLVNQEDTFTLFQKIKKEGLISSQVLPGFELEVSSVFQIP